MDYQLNIYPSTELEMKEFKSENSTKQVRALCENKLSTMYKKSFDAAVAKYNERVTSGRLIDNYLKSISESNIPELYRISLLIRYEPVNREEGEMVQKAFTDFKKKLDEEKNLVIVSIYTTSQNEYRSMEIFFYPVCDGFITGLEVRNDLIGLVKKFDGVDNSKEMNILQAMPLFVKYIEDIFATVNNGNFLSQEELEKRAKSQDENDPLMLHAIAINTLKSQMNEMQNITRESQLLEDQIRQEEHRIKHDIEWSHQKEKEIVEAECNRLEQERLAEIERQRQLEKERALEAQRREEERLREESRRLEAKRFAEQAKRNIEMHNQMAKQMAPVDISKERKVIKSNDYLSDLINRHLKWQEFYNITKETNYNKISKIAMADPRRLSLVGVDFIEVDMTKLPDIIGASFKDCKFTDCNISANLYSSSLESCSFVGVSLSQIKLTKCAMSNLTMTRTKFDDITLSVTAIMKTDFNNSILSGIKSNHKNNYVKCDFSESQFDSCNYQKSSFSDCNFENARFADCDMRETLFQACNTKGITDIDSLFRGSNLKI